uniref:Ycf1 n=1 Tax=Pseudocodium devriesii TaxID=453070 RepID=A0A386B0Y0_9CHLO|nr:hypothetical protein Ycf1 [Pseudocodium devriesii]AYC65347.1 hypothetical protein Ycf1 [Pseudocodium devriesii]
MSVLPLTETVKNTIDVLNDIYKIPDSGAQWITFFKFAVTMLKDWGIYLLTFQWLTDFIKSPILIPQNTESVFAGLFHHLFPDSNNTLGHLNIDPMDSMDSLKSSSVLDAFAPSGPILSGFFNCFFLYLPFSPVQLIWLRRVIIEGQLAGRLATAGLICGHLSLLGCCLFGLRDIINAWFGLEPISYFVGIWLIFTVIFELTHRPLRILKKPKFKELLKIFLINFGLVWTDQPGLYQFFGNLSLHNGVVAMDLASSNSTVIWEYFIGIFVGSFFWTWAISFGVLNLGYFFPRLTNYKYAYSHWIRGFNNFCLTGCVTLILTNFPYYGFDYLFANPLGFVPQDRIWEAVPLPQLKADTVDTNKGRLGEKSSYTSVDTDLSLFDRGRYGGGPFVEFHIESLNYKEEYAWRSRFDRGSSSARGKGGGLLEKYLSTQLGPVEETLKKQKREKRRAQQVQKLQKTSKHESLEKRDFEDEQSYKLPIDFVDFNEHLIERFVEDYTAEANNEDTEIPDLPDEKMIHFSAFSEIAKYGFDVFSMFEAVELDPLDEELAKDIKEKYSENLVYRFLVNMDISNFLKRQPKEHFLTTKDEIFLFQKRLALGEYYDSLRSYSKLPTSQNFRALFCGPKSYVNRIYNQQFKGTLKIVERLFSIHLEEKQNIPPLPEINNIVPTPLAESEEQLRKLKKDSSVLKYDQPLYKAETMKQNPLMHEQFLSEEQKSSENIRPFLQETKPLPFFVGWDNEHRKFLVTNRLLTRQKTLVNTTTLKNDFSKLTEKPESELSVLSKKISLRRARKRKLSRRVLPEGPKRNQLKPKTFTFATWPVSTTEFQKNPFLKKLYTTAEDLELETATETDTDLQDLFKYAEPRMDEDTVYYSLPSLAERVELKNPEKLQTSLAPTTARGGFVWPGHEPLKFQFKMSFKEIIKNWGIF